MPLEISGKTYPNLLKWPTLEQRRLFSSLIECYKTINSLNGLDPSAFFTFANDFQQLRANHRFKLKLASATLNSFKHSFFIRITGGGGGGGRSSRSTVEPRLSGLVGTSVNSPDNRVSG